MVEKISNGILKVEEAVGSVLLVLITTLVFISAVGRTISHPINWAQDVSLLAFGWLTFIGSDVVLRKRDYIRIDIIADKLPAVVQKILALIFDVMMLLFLLVLVVYGAILVSDSWQRTFNTLSISYAWCTLAVPVGSFFMFFSILEKTVRDMKKSLKEWRNKS